MRTTEYDRATTVTFESDGLSIMVTLEASDRGLERMRGWVTATGRRGRAARAVPHPARPPPTTTDASSSRRVERGTVHLVIRHHDEPGARPVITPGIEI